MIQSARRNRVLGSLHGWIALLLLCGLIVLGSFGASRGTGNTQSAAFFTLESAVREALRNNPEIGALRAEREAARARVGLVSWLPDPMVGIEYDGIPPESWSLGRSGMQMYMGSQEIPFPLKIGYRVRQARQEAAALEERVRGKEQEVVARVKSAYYKLYSAHQRLRINNEDRDLLEQFTKIAQTRYSTGVIAQNDLLRAQVEYTKMTNEVITSEQEVQVAEASLGSLLGRKEGQTFGEPRPPPRPRLSRTAEELDSLALRQRPELVAMRREVDAARTSSTLMGMEYLPDFRVRIEHLRANGQSMGKNIAFEANLPLWFWRQGAGVSEAQAMVRMKEAELEAMRNMTMSDIREQYVKAESKKRLADLYQDTVLPLAEQSLKSSRVGYETGRVGFLELLDSQRMLRESQLEYYESEVEFGMAIAELERIVGTDLQGGGP